MEAVLLMLRQATVRGWWIVVAVERCMTAEEVSGRRCLSSEPFRNAGPDALEWRDVAETEVEVVALNHTRVQRGCLMYRVPM